MPVGSPSSEFTMVVTRTTFQSFRRFASTESWSPDVNIYQLPDRLEVAVDLAGIEREQIDVRVEPGRLMIRGQRPAPDPPPPHTPHDPTDSSRSHEGESLAEPHASSGQPMRILSMEIDYGQFSRTLPIPEHINLRRVNSEYREGMLWITLPFEARTSSRR